MNAAPAQRRVTVVGVGNMGGAILDGLRARGWADGQITAVTRTGAEPRPGVTTGSIAAMIPGADVVVVAVKPAQIAAVLATMGTHLRPDQVVVSVAAGVPTAALEAALGTDNPVVRVMPNTPTRVGQGVSVLSAGRHATDEHLAAVTEVFGALGIVETVPEHLQDAATAVSGSGPAYVFAILDALAEAGVQQGLPRDQALRMAAQTFRGATEMVARGAHPVTLREQVSSPGGTTVAGLRELDRHGVRIALSDAVAAARRRSEELGR